MRVLTATVHDGQLDVPADTLHEGDRVTLLIAEDERGFRLSPDEQAALLAAMAQADRGEVIDGWQLLQELED